MNTERVEDNKGIQEYSIIGIERIIEKVGKKRLSEFFELSENSDFTKPLLKYLKSKGIPSGLEIAGYEINKTGNNSYQKESSKYTSDGKAVVGANIGIMNKIGISEEVYFYIDAPIKEELLDFANIHNGGVIALGYCMGESFYEDHKEEIDKLNNEMKRIWTEETQLTDYVERYFDNTNEYKKEQEEIVSKLTDGKYIEQLTLAELEQIKQGLKDRKEQLYKMFSEKFNKSFEQKEEHK